MSETGKTPPLSEKDQGLFKKLVTDRKENAKPFNKPSFKGVIKTIIEMYSEPAHFVYELLQNADDAKAKKARFVLTKSGLIFAHNGTVHFSISDVDTEELDKEKGNLGHINAITSIGQTSKIESEIGKFGIGFRSVFQYTDSPEIYDPPYNFKIKDFVVPDQLPEDHKERKSDENETLFYFPFNSSKTTPDDAYNEITSRLKDLNYPLLFLKNLKHIGWKNDELQWNYSKDEEPIENAKIVSLIYKENQRIVTKFLVFEKEIPHPKNPQKSLKIDIAFKISQDGKSLDSTEKYSPFCFFKTHDQSDLRFIIQAPFVLNNSRERLKENDSDNKYLIQNLALLLGECLPTIRDRGYLSMDFFEILPLPSNDYFDPILTGKYKPLFDIVLEKTKGKEKLLPTNTGGHTNLKNAIIARGGKDFVDLFKDKQLEDLFQRKDIQWLDSGIYDKYRNDKKIWSFFTDEKYLGIAVHRPEDLPKILAKKFLENQDEDWMIGLYSFLLDKKDYSDKLKETPYIRISVPKTEISKRGEIDHVKPSEAYLPIENIDLTHLNANLPIVKTTIAQDPQAKQFLEQIKLTPPDEFAIISQHLQQYSTSPLTITEERNKQSIKLIAKFLKDKRKEQQCEDKLDDLKRQMKGISFFYARNCEEKRELKKPQEIYIPHPYSEDTDLEQFFEKNTNIWFLDSMYAGIPNFTEFWKFLEISTKPKIIKNDFEYHKFQDGFRQDYKLDGLDFFFKNQTMTLKKSLYLWRLLLESQKDSQYKIEFSGYLKYARYKYEKEHGYLGDHAGIVHKNTTILNLLTQHAWIPNKQSEFECPSKVKEFHDDFERLSNEFKDEAEKLFRVLEISSASLNLMEQLRSQIPENEFKKIMLVRETPIEYLEEANRKYQETQKQTETIPEQSAKHFEPRKGIREFFNRPQRRVSTDTPVDAGVVSNPERRREKTAEEIQQACENEPPVSDRFSFSLVKKWDVKNPDTRKFLQHEYGGKCQICESSFKKRGDGEPYFEGVYMNPHIKAASLDRHGNVLCLCPTCRAKILIGSVCVEEDIIQQILDHKLQNEGGIRNFEIPIILCGEERKIEFSEKHILDLQEILRADQSTGLD